MSGGINVVRKPQRDFHNPSRKAQVDVVIVGAGPYGLSLAAHLNSADVAYRIFGEPMEGWLAHMPKGMLLKSDGFASNIYDPRGTMTLSQYCLERGIPYGDAGMPVKIETFTAYGISFQQRLVPQVERKKLTSLDRNGASFILQFNDGEEVYARNVVLAVGVAGYSHVPEIFANLPPDLASHSSHHSDLDIFRGRRLAVIGGGSSAIDIAYLAKQAGAQVHLISRCPVLRFHNPPTHEQRSIWQKIRYPMTGIGSGLRARFYTDAPLLFHHLPQQIRRNSVLGFAPAEGGWFSKEPLLNHVQLSLGHTPIDVKLEGREVHLRLLGSNGTEKLIVADHIISATGYRVDLARLAFLSSNIVNMLHSAYRTPVLSSRFESSVPGLYFVGLPAALSFGPMMRFAFGAGYTARRLTTVFGRLASRSANESRRMLLPSDGGRFRGVS